MTPNRRMCILDRDEPLHPLDYAREEPPVEESPWLLICALLVIVGVLMAVQWGVV